MTAPAISVVVPAYNEAARLGPSLERIAACFRSLAIAFEVIVVDDGSTDDTAAIAGAAGDPVKLIAFSANRGKGAAVRAGVAASRGASILFTDADLSTPIEEWRALHDKLGEGFDIVVGSRGMAGSRIERRQPWYRERMGKTFNWILRRTLPLELKDTQCGFKLFESVAGKRLFATARIDGFAFDAEILYLASRSGCRVGEVPVPWLDSVPSRVHPVWHSAQMLKDLLRIRLLEMAGAYEALRSAVLPEAPGSTEP